MHSINDGKFGEEEDNDKEEFCKECGHAPCIIIEQEANFCAVSEMAKSMGKTNKEIQFMLFVTLESIIGNNYLYVTHLRLTRNFHK